MIVFNNYKKYFGSNLVVNIPDHKLPAGVYWLKGENGSGKTTLIKSVAGLIPFEGNISVAGVDIRRKRTDYKRIVNYAEAEPLYPGFLTGDDLVRFYTSTKNGDEKRVQSLIDLLSIGTYVGNKIGTYSSGMAKKLSLVLAFIGNPKLILLDEPLITLDTIAVKSLLDIIAQYSASGTSFIITSHQEVAIPGISVQQLLIKDKTMTNL